MSPYKHVFFDLDRTLWDMDGNSYHTICELAEKHDLASRGVDSIDEFICSYKVINDQLWSDYSKDLVDKETLRSERFKRAFKLYGIVDDALVDSFGKDYVERSPLKNKLMPHCLDILEYLSSRYQLHIITNGFEEVQHLKIEKSQLRKYFKTIITSEMASCKKPDSRMFQFSLNMANASSIESIMIGDSLEADIIGARNSGIAQVFYNPEKLEHQEKITHEICSLADLRNIL
jgi:putative hydrolase of the HAD superfamily